jgi:NAD+ synthetase
MKIALIQTNPVIGDFPRNSGKILSWIEKAKAQGCDLAIFSELALSGYPPQDLLERPAFLADHDAAFERLLASCRGIGVICGIITRHTGGTGKPLHNSAVLFEDGQVLFTGHKRLLPCYDVFDETRYFEPGQESGTISYKGKRLGITICEDIWNDKNVFQHQLYSVDPVGALLAGASSKVDLLVNISASPFNLGKSRLKQKIFANICSKYQVPLAYVNQVGGQDSLIFDGDSILLDSHGNPVIRAARFAEELVVADLSSLGAEPVGAPGLDSTEIEQVLDALVLGVRDYVGKCGFARVVIGLSGGVDSALTAAIAALALGADNVLGVALPSPYTSPESLEDAELLAVNLGIGFEIINISNIFLTILETLHPLFAEAPQDVTEQNIQARIRGNLLMALANKQGRLVLSTGNKSEMAVGYCTLYGDMSGGLAVISDVPKMMVYELCRLLNQEREIIPRRTLTKAPSAELAPDQKDEDDLPPYEILDPILKAYLEDNLTVTEIIAMGFDRQVVLDVVRRIRLNEYKRKQAPIGLKVTTKAFGYGRRYPTAENYREGQH